MLRQLTALERGVLCCVHEQAGAAARRSLTPHEWETGAVPAVEKPLYAALGMPGEGHDLGYRESTGAPYQFGDWAQLWLWQVRGT